MAKQYDSRESRICQNCDAVVRETCRRNPDGTGLYWVENEHRLSDCFQNLLDRIKKLELDKNVGDVV